MMKKMLAYLFVLAILIVLMLITQKYIHPPRCKNCNVMLISLDQVRAKSLPCFGYGQNTMPNLCKFASRSHIFTNAYATASRTLDSHFSMFTSLYPSAHKMNLPYSSKLPVTAPTIAELLKKEGYQAYYFGVTGDPHLPIAEGIGRGFDGVFDADEPRLWTEAMEKLMAQQGNDEKPDFYFFHTYAAHEPFMPDKADLELFYNGPDRPLMTYEEICRFSYERLRRAHPEFNSINPSYCERVEEYKKEYVSDFEGFDTTYAIFNDRYWQQFDDMPEGERAVYTHTLYAAQMYRLDRELGDFLKRIEDKGMLENTMIIIVGDQGDEFFEHGSYSHGWSLYREVLQVPFIVYMPGNPPGREDKLVSLIDILPTVFGAIGKKISADISGMDVFSPRTHTMVISEHVSDGALSLRTVQHTLIRRLSETGPEIELYDRKSDPDEQTDISADEPDVINTLLLDYKKLYAEFPKHEGTMVPLPSWISEEDRDKLIESGYF